ncbi:MAG: response regulator [Phototrophicaceae bacterium]
MTRSLTCIYFEDNADARLILEMIFPINDMILLVYEDSSIFFDKINCVEGEIACFILDIHISPHSGFEMLKMLRSKKEYHDIPIIALTASVTKDEVDLLRNAGFSGAMSKPVDVALFPQVVLRILEGENIWAIG